MGSLAEEFSTESLTRMMYEESITEEFGIGSQAEVMDEESSRGIQYRKSGRDCR